MIYEALKRTREYFLCSLIQDCSFTVISNNCWGAHIYQTLNLPYKTPFVGLFIPPADFLNLLRNFDTMMAEDLCFRVSSASVRLENWRKMSGLQYPIGVLGDQVELHFLHYKDANDARNKWTRRKARMTNDPCRRFFKFDDREGATPDDLSIFNSLPHPNKVCFAANAFAVPAILAPSEREQKQVLDGVSLSRMSYRIFNTVRWISTRPSWVPLPSLI